MSLGPFPRLIACLLALGLVALAACGSTDKPASVPDVEPVTKPMPEGDPFADIEIDESEFEDEEDDEDDEDEGGDAKAASDAGAPAADAATADGGA